MKTVVRFLIAAGIAFTAVLFVSSCKDDDKDDQTTIIGSWNLDQSRVDVTLNANATNTEVEIEAAIANYITIAANSRVVFTNTKLTFPVSVNGATAKNVTYDYTLNDDVLSVVLPISGVSGILSDVDLTDNVLKITTQEASFLTLLRHYASEDATFKAYIDQISAASVFYRLGRI